jgi:hypothetical protein
MPLFTEKHPRSQEEMSVQQQPTKTANLRPSLLNLKVALIGTKKALQSSKT